MTLQHFEIVQWELLETPTLSQSTPISLNFVYKSDFDVFDGSDSGKLVNVPLVAVNKLGCSLKDYTNFPQGAIALVMRGECNFADKVLYTSTLVNVIVRGRVKVRD